MAMRAPRIMQRKRAVPYEKPEPGPSTSSSGGTNIVEDDINEVLDSSGVYIQDGVMMRIQDGLSSEERRQQAENSAALEASERRIHALQKQRRITVDDSFGFGENTQPYTEKRLPGIADEVESYPCKHCDSGQVFLTGFGLEKHTRMMHNQYLPEVVRQIRVIHEEWKRRNVERTKFRERSAALRYRHESLAMAAAREFRVGSNRNLRRWNDGSCNYVIPSNQLDLDIIGNTAGVIGSAGGPFEACPICNVQINVSHPTAHETHLRAHKRNDELRESLLQEYGQEFVNRLTCHECQLVFTDHKKLLCHNESMHVRRRKFVCKWCGYVCESVGELNEHKIDVHAVPPNVGNRQNQIQLIPSRKDGHSDGKNGGDKNKNNVQNKSETSSAAVDESQFSVTRTCCPECSLPFNRPSLLLKHMLRVHSKCTFSASIETRGLPSFSVQVDRGRVVWTCCQRDFHDRVSFASHRQSHSISAVADHDLIPIGVPTSSSRKIPVQTMPQPQQEVVVSSGGIKDEYDQNAIMGEDGTIEIMIPRGVKHGEMQFMMIVDDANGMEGKPKIVAIDPRTDPEEVMRFGSSVIESNSREPMEGREYDEDENGQIILSSEQFEQWRMQYGDISDLNIVYMDDGQGNRIEDGNVEENGRGREEDANDLQHDILEPSES